MGDIFRQEISEVEFNPYPTTYKGKIDRSPSGMQFEMIGVDRDPATLLSIARDLMWLAAQYHDQAVRMAIENSPDTSENGASH